MAIINVAIKFGVEYFCFGIYFSKIFYRNFFPKIFFSKFLFQNFYSKIFIPKFLFQNFFVTFFFPKYFSQHFFSKFLKIFFPTFSNFFFFFFEGFILDASQFTETLCIFVMDNMISKRSKLDFSLV